MQAVLSTTQQMLQAHIILVWLWKINAGFQQEMKVVNGVSDTSPPVLVDFTVSEQCIDVTNNSVDVIFTAEITDDISGVASILVLSFPPINNPEAISLNLISGTVQDGVFQGTLNYDATAIDGYHHFNVFLEDAAGNFIDLVFQDGDLLNLGFQDYISVTNQVNFFHTQMNTIQIASKDHGLVFKEASGDCKRLSVDNVGTLMLSNIPCAPTGKDVCLDIGNVFIDALNPNLILKAPNNNCWKILYDTQGGMTTVSTSCVTTNANIIQDGDIYFNESSIVQGVVVKESNTSCYKLGLDVNGQLESRAVCCPQ